MLIDIGANLTHESFQSDIKSVILRAKESYINQIIVTGSSLNNSSEAEKLTKEFDSLYSTAGIHPHHAEETNNQIMEKIEEITRFPKVVAIGETGLDFYRNFTPADVQISSFEKHLELAEKSELPMFLHERDAHKKFEEILSSHRSQLGNVVVHCFTGDRKALFKYLDLDCFIGITGWICDERRGENLQKLVKEIPKNRLMIETDAPYLMPRTLSPRLKNRRCEPMHLNEICHQIALHTGKSFNYWAKNTSDNARLFFALPENK